jgi:hypothetical protein
MKHALSFLLLLAVFTMPAFAQIQGALIQQTAPSITNVTAAPTTLTFPSVGYGIASVSVHGTYSGFNVSFLFSDDTGTTYYTDSCTRSDTAVQENTSGSLTNTSRSWDCGIFGTTNFRLSITGISTGTATVTTTLSTAPIEPAPTVSVSGAVTDATNSAGLTTIVAADTSAPINITSTGTTQIVAASAGKSVHITGFGVTVSTSAASPQTFTIVQGTGTNCAGGQLTIAGPFTGGIQETLVAESLPTVITYGGGLGQIAQGVASDDICITTTGTQAIGGILSFAQFFYLPPTDEYAAEGEPFVVWRGGRMPRLLRKISNNVHP